MDNDSLPGDHDVIVLGTGMTESIVAAALSRIGLRVLHLERNDGYGGNWGSFNFSTLQQWIVAQKNTAGLAESSMAHGVGSAEEKGSGERVIRLPNNSTGISNVVESELVLDVPGAGGEFKLVNVSKDDTAAAPLVDPSAQSDEQNITTPSTATTNETPHSTVNPDASKLNDVDKGASKAAEQNTEQEETKGKALKDKVPESLPSVELKQLCDVKKQWRKFAIDLMPKVLFSKGPLVELLISSDVAKYCEFRSVTRILTLKNGKLEQVPCSRADVFASHDVSVIEKRLLMKLLTFCMEYQKHPNEYAGFHDKPFVEFLKAKKLTATIRHYVQHAIAMATDTTPTLDGLAATQKFLMSLGRYGNTAFLWPLYGSGELLQCFCRMCAVFGGIYCLRRALTELHVDASNKVVSVTTNNGQRLTTKWVIMDAAYASPELLPARAEDAPVRRISRAVLITDRSLRPDKDQEHITVLSLALPERTDTRVILYELSSLSLACPDKLYVVHLTCMSRPGGTGDARGDLGATVASLFHTPEQDAEVGASDDRPRVLWSLYFNIEDTSRRDVTSTLDNVIMVGGPDATLDCDHSITQARAVFERVCPGEEFLPRAPNPEDIIYDDGEGKEPRESGFEPIPEASSEAELGAGDVGGEEGGNGGGVQGEGAEGVVQGNGEAEEGVGARERSEKAEV